ncbi:hypothetical protein [Streptomyces solaniscabiei]|uniref:hypothetical protein n=1 Tax=Streptomyces solaniscabiei TaxID=2683255 RepID=UPI001CE351A2|nr:hypothetical protein [Streptomyces solaniscabiei]
MTSRTSREPHPDDTGLDGELVVWEAGCLAFERLQVPPAPVPAADQPVRSFLPQRSTAFASRYSHSGERAPRPYLCVGRRHAAHGPI